MLSLHAGDFLGLLQLLFDFELTVGQTRGPLPPNMAGANQAAANAIRMRADALNLPVTKGQARYIEVSKTSEELSVAFLTVKRTMHQELLNRVFVEPEPRYKGYYEQSELFGREVFNAFPSSNSDIYKSGMCLALERATACVMHLNRALECGLAALAKAVGVSKQNDWGRYIEAIGKELDTRTKAAGARSADEQFYAEAAANFDRLRRVYRNPTMHPEKTYSQERAEEILQAVRSFMAHLATRLSE